jgi:hypothetical protein
MVGQTAVEQKQPFPNGLEQLKGASNDRWFLWFCHPVCREQKNYRLQLFK